MTIHLRPELENEMRRLARERGREMDAIIDEALRSYVDAAAISDLTSEDIGRTQKALASELSPQDNWETEGSGDDAAR